MIIHNLVQGSPEWLAHRSKYRNASDAPAMMSISAYKTRSQLLKELSTGITEETDSFTQTIFDNGHKFEALARPHAEKIIGEDLYPVVGTKGNLGASFDGLTMNYKIGYEHKSLNNELCTIMVDGCTGKDLSAMYQIQMQQQCMVSGAEKILFVASKWSGDELDDMRHCWYESNDELAELIEKRWALFDADLLTYTPIVDAVAVEGKSPANLPAILIQMTGEVRANNLAEYKSHAMSVVESINTNLLTDEDFASAEKTVTWCSDVESKLAAAKQHALSQTKSIDEAFRMIDEISEAMRSKRLSLEKLVKSRKDSIRLEIVQEHKAKFEAYVLTLNGGFPKPYLVAPIVDFGAAIKGKKTVSSVRDAANAALNSGMIAASDVAENIRSCLAVLVTHASEHKSLFPDTASLVLKNPADLEAVVKQRVTDFVQDQKTKADLEAKRLLEGSSAMQAKEEIKLLEIAPSQVIREVSKLSMSRTTRTLKLGEISALLGFSITADYLQALGFNPVSTDKSAKMYSEQQFAGICDALCQKIGAAKLAFSKPPMIEKAL
jgi:putative phage-type endonuclease